jgi:hypothetical protein
VRKWVIRYHERTTLEERWKQFLEATGRTEEEYPLKEFARVEYEAYYSKR